MQFSRNSGPKIIQLILYLEILGYNDFYGIYVATMHMFFEIFNIYCQDFQEGCQQQHIFIEKSRPLYGFRHTHIHIYYSYKHIHIYCT